MTDQIIIVLATIIVGTLSLDVRALKRELSDQRNTFNEHHGLLRAMDQYVSCVAGCVAEQGEQIEALSALKPADAEDRA